MRIFRITSDIFTLCFIFAPPLFGSSSRFTAFPLAASVRTLGIVVRDVHNLRKVSLLINCRVNNAPPHGMHTFARVRVARPSFSLSLSLSLSLPSNRVTRFSFFPSESHFFRLHLFPSCARKSAAATNVQRIEISHVISYFRGKKLYLRLALILLRRKLLSI